MGARGRWRSWLVGYALVWVVFGLAWGNNPSNIGTEREVQRVWLALGYSVPGLLLFLPALASRKPHEVTAQRTLIVSLAIYMALAMWWVGFLPTDVFGCSRVEAPDCHTQPGTRWRALGEISVAWLVAIAVTRALGGLLERRNRARAA